MKTRFSLQSALIAGAIATFAMTLFTYMAPIMGFEMNIPGMLAHTIPRGYYRLLCLEKGCILLIVTTSLFFYFKFR